MNQNDEYYKSCPFCNKQFLAKHLSRVYCSEAHKRRMFRKKQQNIRKQKNEDEEALELNALGLQRLLAKGQPNYARTDLDSVKFNHKCYDRKYKIENYIIYTIKDYLLVELSNRVFKIIKCF